MTKFIERTPAYPKADTSFIQKKWFDVPYAQGARRKLDIYLPNDEQNSYPVIIDVYGGGMYFGKKSSNRMNGALKLLKKGYAVVSPDYSLSYMADFKTAVYELKAVVRFVRANANNYLFNPDQVFMMGQSSGAQLAMLTATSAASHQLESELGGNQNYSSLVNGVIASYGPYNLMMMKPEFDALGETPNFKETGEADSFEGQMLGGKRPGDVPKLNAEANPRTYLNKEMVPTLFFAGTGDRVVPYVQTINMAASVIEVIGADKVKTHLVAGAPHGESGFLSDQIINEKDQFMKAIMDGPK